MSDRTETPRPTHLLRSEVGPYRVAACGAFERLDFTIDPADTTCHGCQNEGSTARIEKLESWKAEALQVLGEWEDVWHALGQPGELGESKAVAALRTVLAHSDGEDSDHE